MGEDRAGFLKQSENTIEMSGAELAAVLELKYERLMELDQESEDFVEAYTDYVNLVLAATPAIVFALSMVDAETEFQDDDADGYVDQF